MIDEVQEVLTSEFALSQEVREAAMNADEIRMLYSPTLVKNGEGDRFIINGRAYFMDYEGTKGCDIALADTGHKTATLLLDFDGAMHKYGESHKHGGRPPLPLTLVAADWMECFR